MTRMQTTVFILLAVVALVLGLTVNTLLTNSDRADPAVLLDAGIVLLPQHRRLPALTLTNQDGQPVAVDQLKGKWSLLFFGYTFCPDICPTTLAQLRELQTQLPPAARSNLQVIFVSVDPHRDTPAQIKQYLEFFKAGFQGLTGDEATLQKFANAVSIPFISADTSQENYTVDHSGNLVIIGPDGRQHGFIRGPLNNQKLKEHLPGLLTVKQ